MALMIDSLRNEGVFISIIFNDYSPAFVGLFYLSANHIKFTYLIKEIIMGKGKDSKKATKKAPTKTAKEKRAEKKLKKAIRD